MNPYIKLVKKWLADNDSVSSQELRANETAAWADLMQKVWPFAIARVAWGAARNASLAAYWAYRDPDRAQNYKQCAIEAIARYEELTK